MSAEDKYIDFLRSKMAISRESGFAIDRSELTESLYPHVKDSVEWAVRGGCRAIFSAFGMQKTVTQLEILRLIIKREGGKGLITDVVRENNQTYRLGYTEMCKDGTKMGIGCPEYVLLFRKLPTDTSKAYADVPVTKEKGGDYSLARWQIDAHASWKSSGNRLLLEEDLTGLDVGQIRQLFRDYSRSNRYDFSEHVAFAEKLEERGKLPKTFMAIDPVSKKDYIWDDVVRMRTLNCQQSQKNKQMHVCPLQLDIVERLIERYSNKGEVVFDPFGGIQTVPYCAVKMGRFGLSTELNEDYWKDGIGYLVEAEMEVSAPTLFDLMEMES